jgi:putative transposase
LTLAVVAEAEANGARLKAACEVVGVSVRTVQRWRQNPAGEDRRCGPKHRPSNALTPAEEAKVVRVMTTPQNAGVSPKQLVPKLADEGVYLASESTMYRLQRRYGLRKRRRHASRTHVNRAKTAHCATGPNEVWSWDITWLPTVIRGSFLKLYMVLDVWSRRIVGWDVHRTESAEHAAGLIDRIADELGVDPAGIVLHADNGMPMRGSTMVAKLQELGMIPSFSRPHVSDDNPYSEALFRTLKHTPAYPKLPFASLEDARRWVARFVDWYNGEHRHSGIRYVTPNERHFGQEAAILARRQQVYERARRRNPQRWTGNTRNWTPVGQVELNPPSPKQLAEAA